MAEIDEAHWERQLPRPLREGEQVTITAHPSVDGAMTVLASRIEALHTALGRPAGATPAEDALAGEDAADLLRLLDHLHRVIGTLIGQEDRLIEVLAAAHGVSLRSIAAAMEVNHRTVAHRRKRIARAAEAGTNTSADDGE